MNRVSTSATLHGVYRAQAEYRDEEYRTRLPCLMLVPYGMFVNLCAHICRQSFFAERKWWMWTDIMCACPCMCVCVSVCRLAHNLTQYDTTTDRAVALERAFTAEDTAQRLTAEVAQLKAKLQQTEQVCSTCTHAHTRTHTHLEASESEKQQNRRHVYQLWRGF